MAKKICKYPLTTNGVITKLSGKFNRLLSIQNQNGQIFAWIELDDKIFSINLELVAIKDEIEMPKELEDFNYFDTVQQWEYVWHYYWRVV